MGRGAAVCLVDVVVEECGRKGCECVCAAFLQARRERLGEVRWLFLRMGGLVLCLFLGGWVVGFGVCCVSLLEVIASALGINESGC